MAASSTRARRAFNCPAPATLASSLQSLTFHCLFMFEYRVRLKLGWYSTTQQPAEFDVSQTVQPEFGGWLVPLFSQSLEDIRLPSSLQSLTLAGCSTGVRQYGALECERSYRCLRKKTAVETQGKFALHLLGQSLDVCSVGQGCLRQWI